MLRIRRKGQTAVEYVVLLVILIGALLGIQNYFKRGLQGRWKSVVDDLGDQYDPRMANTAIRHVLVQNTNTSVISINAIGGGHWTKRTDDAVMRDSKSGYMVIGGY